MNESVTCVHLTRRSAHNLNKKSETVERILKNGHLIAFMLVLKMYHLSLVRIY